MLWDWMLLKRTAGDLYFEIQFWCNLRGILMPRKGNAVFTLLKKIIYP